MRTPTVIRDMRREDNQRRAHAAAGDRVFAELQRSRQVFPNRLHSLEEAASVLEEELDELKDAVRANMTGHARAEAIQVAAMALRLVVDVTDAEACQARDRLAVQAALTSARRYPPEGPLVSAHEGRGYLRCWQQRLCDAIVAEDPQKAFHAANAIAALALRFVAEVPADDSKHQALGYRR